MKTFRKQFGIVGTVIFAFGLVGCPGTKFIPNDLPKASEAEVSTRGSVIVMNGKTNRMEGELVAIESDTVFIFQNKTLTAIPTAHVTDARLFVTQYPLRSGSIVSWTGLGTLLSLSHGWGFFATAPLWLITGTITNFLVVHDADNGDLHYPADSWLAFQKYSRFPQGFPVGLERNKLQPSLGDLLHEE